MKPFLRRLQGVDACLAAVEATVLCLLLFGLAAGGLALVVQQNSDDAGASAGAVTLWIGLGLTLLGLALAARRPGSWVERLRGGGGRLLLVGGLLLLLALALQFGQVIDYLVRVSVLWIGVVGASLATRQRNHITIEALEKFLPRQARRLAHAAIFLTAAILLVILAGVAWEYTQDARERGDALFVVQASGFEFPSWWAKAILPVGLALMAWRFALLLLETVVVGVPEPEPPPAEEEAVA